MGKLLLRLVALVLVPCLALADVPFSAAGAPASVRLRPSFFVEEALALHAGSQAQSPIHAKLSRLAGRTRRAVIPALVFIAVLPFFTGLEHELGHAGAFWAVRGEHSGHIHMVFSGEDTNKGEPFFRDALEHPWRFLYYPRGSSVDGTPEAPGLSADNFYTHDWEGSLFIRTAGTVTTLTFLFLILNGLVLNVFRKRGEVSAVLFVTVSSLALASILSDLHYAFIFRGLGDWYKAAVDLLMSQGAITPFQLQAAMRSGHTTDFYEAISTQAPPSVLAMIQHKHWLLALWNFVIPAIVVLATDLGVLLFWLRRTTNRQVRKSTLQEARRYFQWLSALLAAVPLALSPLLVIPGLRHHPWLHQLGNHDWSVAVLAATIAALMSVTLLAAGGWRNRRAKAAQTTMTPLNTDA